MSAGSSDSCFLVLLVALWRVWPKGCKQVSPARRFPLLSKGTVCSWYQVQWCGQLRVPPSGEFGKQASADGRLSTQAGLRVSWRVRERERARVRVRVLSLGQGVSDVATQTWSRPRPEVRARSRRLLRPWVLGLLGPRERNGLQGACWFLPLGGS